MHTGYGPAGIWTQDPHHAKVVSYQAIVILLLWIGSFFRKQTILGRFHTWNPSRLDDRPALYLITWKCVIKRLLTIGKAANNFLDPRNHFNRRRNRIVIHRGDRLDAIWPQRPPNAGNPGLGHQPANLSENDELGENRSLVTRVQIPVAALLLQVPK